MRHSVCSLLFVCLQRLRFPTHDIAPRDLSAQDRKQMNPLTSSALNLIPLYLEIILTRKFTNGKKQALLIF